LTGAIAIQETYLIRHEAKIDAPLRQENVRIGDRNSELGE
jgi:hypothetical protein